MPGPMDPRTDRVARWIYLDDLRRKLRYIKYDELDLEHLQPLRDEVEAELKRTHTFGGVKNDELAGT